MTTPTTPRRGTNLPRMGDYNTSVILDAIRRADEGMSRVELASLTGLSAQTVSNICRRLLADGLIAAAGRRSNGAGMPRTLLRVVPDARYALGVHLDPASVTYVVLDLDGRMMHSERHPTPAVVDSEATLADMAVTIERVIADSGAQRERFLGLGIAVPGPVDLVAGSVIAPPLLAEWGRAPMRERLAAATGLPVLMDKDVIAAAVAERWAGEASGSRDFLFFYLGTGSGMGVVSGDAVLRGSSGNAGEVGGLDANLTTLGLVDEAVNAGLLAATGDGPHGAAEQVVRLTSLAMSDDRAKGILEAWALRVAHGVSAAATFLDSDLVVFGGPMWDVLAEHFAPIVEPVVTGWPFATMPHEIRVASSRLGRDVGAMGAACLVLDQTLAPHPQTLLLS